MTAPGTVPCRAPFPTFLVHQRPEGAAEHGDAALLVEILQERKKAGGAIQGGRGLADGIAGREDERPLPERLAAPGTVPCRVPFLSFLIHQRSRGRCGPACVMAGP